MYNNMQQTIQNGGLQMYDMLMELNGENMYGQTIQSVSRAMVSIPPGARTTLKMRRSSAFVQQQLMLRQQADFQTQLAAQQQQQYQYQQQYQQQYQPGYGGGPVVYATQQQQPAFGIINAPGYQVRTRHTYRPYSNYSGYGYYGAYAMLEYDSDMMRSLACRWITMGIIPISIGIILMASVPSVWYFFLFIMIAGLINVGRGIFYYVKANELAELDRTQPLQAQTFASPIVVQMQQGAGYIGQPPAQAYVYPSSQA